MRLFSKLKRKDKWIIVFFIIFGVSYVSGASYVDSTFEDSSVKWPSALKEVEHDRILQIDREKIFLAFADVENYPSVLPENVVSVKIIDKTVDYILVEYVLKEGPFNATLSAKHIIDPYNSQIVEITDGEAKGTKIIQTFSDDPSGVLINTKVSLELSGFLIPISWIPEQSFVHAMDTIISAFYCVSTSSCIST